MALKTGFVSHPAKDRFSSKTVPMAGGIAIFATIASFLIAAIIFVKVFAVPPKLDWLSPAVTIHAEGFISKIPQLIVVIACLATLFILGLWDDKFHLGPSFKLVIQFAVAAVAAVFANVRVEFFIHNQYLATVLSIFWIALIINAFNFLDNMDGLSAGIALIISSVLLVAASLSGQVFVAAMALLLIGTLAGFLVRNFPPAKIFMGDAGSMVIGFMIALLSLRTTYYNQALSKEWYPVLLPLIAMAVPLYDFISVTILRISQGKSPFVGDTQHFSHRLKRHGLTDTQVALTLYLATLCTSLGATFLYQVSRLGAVLIAIQTVMILLIIAIFESTVKNEKNHQ